MIDSSLLSLLDDDHLKELGVASALHWLLLKQRISKKKEVLQQATQVQGNAHDTSPSLGYLIPVMNLFYDILFDGDPPSNAGLKDVLNNFGLFNALLLTIVMAIPAAI